MDWLRKLEHVLLILGVLLLAVFVVARADGAILSKAVLQRFKAKNWSRKSVLKKWR